MNIFKRNKDNGTTELVGNEALGEGTPLSEATTKYLTQLEDDAARQEDPAGWAAEQLGHFQLTPGARMLCDRALDNLSRNTGQGLDEDAKFDARLRAEIISAGGNDLSVIIDALSSSCEVDEAGGMVYSLLFNTLKAAVFIGNLDYRQFLDPTRDMDMHLYVNYGEVGRTYGEDARDPDSQPQFNPDNRSDRSPLEGQSGFETGAEFQLARLKTLYGNDIDDEGDVVAASLRDLRYYFQLLAESFGWDPNRPMPFANVAEPDGTFTPVTDASAALDLAELRRQAARAKRKARQGAVLNAAAAKAREALAKASARRG